MVWLLLAGGEVGGVGAVGRQQEADRHPQHRTDRAQHGPFFVRGSDLNV